MSDASITKGSCLCGAVTLEAHSVSQRAGACHCGMCRKWSGGPSMTAPCSDKVTVIGEDKVAVFASSEWAERAFCKDCGTHLYYRLRSNNLYFLPVGLLEEHFQAEFDHQLFIDEKPEYYSFSNQTKNMTGEEVFSQFASEQDEGSS